NNLVMLRNDFNLSDTQNLFWHYYYNENERPNRLTGNIPGWGEWSSASHFHNFGVNHDYTLSPNLINQFKFGFTRSVQSDENKVTIRTEELGMDYPNYTPYGTPRFNITGRFSIGSDDEFNNDSDAW